MTLEKRFIRGIAPAIFQHLNSPRQQFGDKTEIFIEKLVQNRLPDLLFALLLIHVALQYPSFRIIPDAQQDTIDSLMST
ncbi:hypothetical protein [Oligoflexus sp.]|uniref:hypothetical protein n=1 Tax=Oligoflexus sp. TaxID=1971216 RepID=UPI002D7676AC|nr:hypothetical protein [Oligoflexus sp.]